MAENQRAPLAGSSATALGGSRPKVCFVQNAEKQDGGTLAVAPLPSVFDRYPVAKAYMLLGQLAQASGIWVVGMALKNLCHGTVLITRRLGRDEHGDRNPYLSARSLLLAEEGEDLRWMDLLSAMRACCKNSATDAPQLWLRLLFTGLINADLSLRKIVFLCSGQGRWRLAPATGFRPACSPESQRSHSSPQGRGCHAMWTS